MRSAWLALLILAGGAAAYANSFSGIFLFDDLRNIVENPAVQHVLPLTDHLGTRRPVVSLSFALNYRISELDPWSYHAANLAIHLLAALALFGIVRRTLLRGPLGERYRSAAPWLALSIALLWVVHPLTTQSVTYVVQRGESLMGLFYLATLYCVVRGIGSARPGPWYAAAVVACALGMGSKAVMVSAPVVVFLYDCALVTRSPLRSLRRRWGLYAGLAATWLVLVGTGVASGVLNPDPTRHTTVGFGFKEITPLRYLQSQAGVIAHYLRLAVWPSGLCLDYAWPVVASARDIVPYAVAIVALLGLTVWSLWRRPWLGFAGVWFFAILAPTSSFIPIRDLAFEHRMYLPLAAVLAVVVAAAFGLLNLAASRWPQQAAPRRFLAAGAVGAGVLALGVTTHMRNRDYQDELTMWRAVASVRPDNDRARGHIARELAARGRLEEAIAAYRWALELGPGNATTHNNLANALRRNGDDDEALAHYREAVRLDPGFALAHLNLARLLLDQRRPDEAISELRAAVREAAPPGGLHGPRLAEAYILLGNTCFQRQAYEEAAEAYRAAISIRPDQYGVHHNLAAALEQMNRIDEAIAEYRETLRLKPDHTHARERLTALSQRDRD